MQLSLGIIPPLTRRARGEETQIYTFNCEGRGFTGHIIEVRVTLRNSTGGTTDGGNFVTITHLNGDGVEVSQAYGKFKPGKWFDPIKLVQIVNSRGEPEKKWMTIPHWMILLVLNEASIDLFDKIEVIPVGITGEETFTITTSDSKWVTVKGFEDAMYFKFGISWSSNGRLRFRYRRTKVDGSDVFTGNSGVFTGNSGVFTGNSGVFTGNSGEYATNCYGEDLTKGMVTTGEGCESILNMRVDIFNHITVYTDSTLLPVDMLVRGEKVSEEDKKLNTSDLSNSPQETMTTPAETTQSIPPIEDSSESGDGFPSISCAAFTGGQLQEQQNDDQQQEQQSEKQQLPSDPPPYGSMFGPSNQEEQKKDEKEQKKSEDVVEDDDIRGFDDNMSIAKQAIAFMEGQSHILRKKHQEMVIKLRTERKERLSWRKE
jgi:hypothetical protein